MENESLEKKFRPSGIIGYSFHKIQQVFHFGTNQNKKTQSTRNNKINIRIISRAQRTAKRRQNKILHIEW